MISIIIPVHNAHEMTADCLTAVREHTKDYELVIVDNGSTPPIVKPYTGFVDCTLIRNEENLGFPKAVNQGIAAAKGEIIVLLNNDVIVTPGWAEKLTAALADYAIVCPVTNYCGGVQQVQIGTYENEAELAREAHEWADHWQDTVDEVRWLIGFCMAFPRSLRDAIGPFDESLWPCCGEEVDFCLRARQAGHRVGIVRGCYVHHEGSQTFASVMDNDEYAKIVIRNEAHLEQRWGKDWKRQEIGTPPEPQGLCLNLGSGYRKLDGYINLDNRPECKPDIVCDVLDGLPYPDNSVAMVRVDDFLEHIPIGKVIGVMEEIWRVLIPMGTLVAHTPSTDGRGAFQDPTHVSFWNINSFFYFSDKAHRDLYGIKADFAVEHIKDTEPDGNGVIHTDVIARARK